METKSISSPVDHLSTSEVSQMDNGSTLSHLTDAAAASTNDGNSINISNRATAPNNLNTMTLKNFVNAVNTTANDDCTTDAGTFNPTETPELHQAQESLERENHVSTDEVSRAEPNRNELDIAEVIKATIGEFLTLVRSVVSEHLEEHGRPYRMPKQAASTGNPPYKKPPYQLRAMSAARKVQESISAKRTYSVDQAGAEFDIPPRIVQQTMEFLQNASDELIGRVERGELLLVDALKGNGVPTRKETAPTRSNTRVDDDIPF